MYELSRRRLLLLGAGTAASIMLAACGDDDADETQGTDAASRGTQPDPDPTSAPPADTAATTAPPSTSSETPAADAYDLEAPVRFTWQAPPTTFDPHRSQTAYDLVTLQNVYDRLFTLTVDGLPAPGVVGEWEFSDDGLQLDLTIREGLVFHDGTALDAEAVRANLERAKTVEGSTVAADLAIIDTVEVLAPTRLRLHLSAQAAELPAVLSDRPGMLVSPAAFDKPDLDVAPVGSGMYRVTRYVEGSEITFERFDDYWDPDAVRASGLDWSISTDPLTRFNALRSGQTDGTSIDPSRLREAEDAGLNVVKRAGVIFFHLQLNRSREPFAKVEVRRALNHAIDRQSIVDSVLFGQGEVSSQIFPEWHFAFDPETGTNAFEYDPELARQLLADAGYPDGFEFEMLYQTTPQYELIASAIQAQLAEVGITANARGIPVVEAAEIFYARQEGDALAAPASGRADPTQTLRQLFSDQGFSNPGRHTTPEMLAAIEATSVVQSPEDRARALRAASAQITADALDVVLFFPTNLYAFSPEVLGPDTWGFGWPDFRYVGMRQS